MLIRICCSCKAVLDEDGEPAILGIEDREIQELGFEPTHGYCPECFETAIADARAVAATLREKE